VLAATFVLFAIGGMGGGDAKLMAATAVWMGFEPVLLEYLLYASFIGGMLTLATLFYRKSIFADLTRHNMFLRHFADSKVGIPYGVALGFAGLAIYPKTALVGWALARIAA
jgi:prepilin peptidase CpaA